MSNYFRYIKSVILLFLLSFNFMKAECDICEFTMDEIFFNESIVGYYMAGFDLSTGSSNVYYLNI